jgi:hypothetical protein
MYESYSEDFFRIDLFQLDEKENKWVRLMDFDERENEWVKLRDIGDRVLFLGIGRSFSFRICFGAESSQRKLCCVH